MLSISNLTYKIGARTLIENSSLNVTDGWKVGVVGINGAGKTTLFKLISNEIQPDNGHISITAQQKFGQVRQDIPDCDTPLIEMVLSAHKDLTELFKQSETETDPYKMADIYAQLNELDAYTAHSRAAILLTGLGFNEDQMQAPFSSLSGGWRMRVALAAALFVEPEILLLDEPTNHLDLEAIMWLETYLASYPHTLLVISHDRELLNKCVDHVIHVDKQKLTLYTGNYDTFERERTAKLGLQKKMHEKQLAHRAHMQAFVDRFRYKATKARQAQSRIKALERMNLVDAVIADRSIKFNFPQPDKLSAPLISIQEVDVGYTEEKPILRNIYESIDMNDRIALLGANGNGKSTMIKLIAGKLPAMKGNIVRSGKLRIGYFSQHQTEELDIESTPYQEMSRMVAKKTGSIRESAIRGKLGQFGFSKMLADNRIGNLSGGEKARLLFAFMSYDSPHILLLDEPTNHLDIDAREALIQALNAYEGAVILVSHDPGMIERVADSLWLVNDGTCAMFDGNLEDYRKFIIKSRRENRKERKNKKVSSEKKSTSQASLKKKTEEAEKEVLRLTAEKDRMEDLMADIDLYSDHSKIKQAQQAYAIVLKDLQNQETLWLELEEMHTTVV